MPISVTATDNAYSVSGPLFSDTFTRSVSAPGLGTGYTWSSWDSKFTATTSPTYVDGSAGRMPSGTGGGNYDSWQITAVTPPLHGALQFDVFVPALAGIASGYPAFGIVVPIVDSGSYGGTPGNYYYAGMYVGGANTSGGYNLGSFAGDPTVTFTPTTSSWITVKCEYYFDTGSKQVVQTYKWWAQGGTEPGSVAGTSFNSPTIFTVATYGFHPIIDIYQGSKNNTDDRFDNIIFWDLGAASGLSDSLSRGLSLQRSGSDTVSLSDSVAGSSVLGQRLAVLTDTISSIADSLTRQVLLARSVAETIATSDAVTAIYVLVRSATENLTSVAGSVAASVGTLVRNVADLIFSIWG